ncbi:MAG: response regulator [Alphaproteobacteria bacterium]|nr:response regulator [Alphaproteobacteria bacterium]
MLPLWTILLVDDESELRDLIAATLTKPGYEVLTASDGYEAIRIIVSRKVDLLLTDIRLPGLSGFDLARQARLMRPHLHVIYMSGYHVENERGVGPTYGRLLAKPIRQAHLIGEVNAELGF